MAMAIEEMKALYVKAKKAYFNSEPIMKDAQFDKLEDAIRKADPKWKELKKTGVKIKLKKKEVALTEPMPSLNKAYPEAIGKFLKKHGDKYIVMDKLDGGAFQLTVEKGRPVKLVTRGDGVRGGDVSFLLPHLLPAKLKVPVSGIFRCEAVMSNKTFAKKYAKDYENPRNLVNGVLNRSMEQGAAADPVLADTHLVVLGMYGAVLGAGLARAKQMGLRVVGHAFCKITGSELLEQRLELRRNEGEYDIDGLVVAPESFALNYKSADKPKNIIAFKVNDEENASEATVKAIIWQVTGHGRIIPKIEIKPVRLDGVTVKHATVHNAKWMLDRKIGPGATIKILRSGGVIPKIVGVVKAGKVQLPEIEHNLKGVHFVAVNTGSETSERIRVLRILKFMRTLGVELLADKTITQCLSSSLESPLAYVSAWKRGILGDRLIAAEVGAKQSAKIVAEFDRVFSKPIPMAQFLVATHVFEPGVGERRLKMLQAAGLAMSSLLKKDEASLIQSITEVHGFSHKTAKLVAVGLLKGKKKIALYGAHIKLDGGLPAAKKQVKGPLTGQVVSFTGYRDEQQEIEIENAGGEVASFSKKTTILLIKAGGKASSKIEKAIEAGVRVTNFHKLGL